MNETEKQIQEIRSTVSRIETQMGILVERLGEGPGKAFPCISHLENVKQSLIRIDNIERTQNRWNGGLAVLIFVCGLVNALVLKLWK